MTKVEPTIEGGAFPAKAVVGEEFPIRARVFREGHDAVAASAILTAPSGRTLRTDLRQVWPQGLDIWEAWVRPDEEGAWTFRVEGWSDPWHTYLHNAMAKLPAGIDVPLVCLEGQRLFRAAAEGASREQATVLDDAVRALEPTRSATELLATITAEPLAEVMRVCTPRELLSPTREYPLFVERQRALFASWYEFFPRSVGAHRDRNGHWVSGTFDTATERLDAAADMGFDVVYLPPIHPIGTAFRKGRNNSLDPGPEDPGSPWAIGSADGGHDAIHPDLGDEESFARFVDHARGLGLEVAIDLALQASPDHPWVTTHPEWFSTRADGTIAYAENPPKKYQDIYPINFDNDPDGIYAEVLRIVKLWISRGVTIFRVDNPHTKPISFWAWLMAEVRAINPEIIFLAEAFTRPEMMHMLGKVGFTESYTYFTWRNTKTELSEYLTELSRDMAAFYRPNFFVNTPDINPAFVQSGLPAAFAIRAVLASTLSPAWGVYSGFELFEHAPLKPGGEEYLDSEKYQYRPRNYYVEPNLTGLITKLNAIRRQHPALQQLRRIDFHATSNDDVIVYSKVDGDDVIIVACSLHPESTVEAAITIDYSKLGLGLAPDAEIHVVDELGDHEFWWHANAFVRLPPEQPAHILHVRTGGA